MSDSLWPHGQQHTRPPCPSPTPGVHPNSCASSWWCHPTISSSIVPFSCPQSLLASGSFPMSQLFTWGGQSTGVSASTSVLLVNTQDWYPLGWTGWISFQSKGLTRVLSSTTVQNHQFFHTQNLLLYIKLTDHFKVQTLHFFISITHLWSFMIQRILHLNIFLTLLDYPHSVNYLYCFSLSIFSFFF